MSGMQRSAGVRSTAKGIIELRAVTYNRVDDYQSVFAPGCLTEGLRSYLPPIAFGHDWLEPIGRVTAWRDSADGPILTARLDTSPDVPRGRQVLAQIESGTLTDVSIGFHSAVRREPTDAERVQFPGVREIITKASLSEVSVVLEGAVPGSRVLSVRSNMDSLKRDLARGRITPAQYRAASSLDREIDDALATLSRNRRASQSSMAEPISLREARLRIAAHAQRNAPRRQERRAVEPKPDDRPLGERCWGF